ncbi:7,8-didemethyl-8-hydroxy-5-deazariboflavin synthase subunit [alpha proteobacterium U9-1i]|nr:7,8-didemethyl-8-hydroxy-5-deazariboflavin synthase subunit [alpha proteobacterium U9-1i]
MSAPLEALLLEARALRDAGHGAVQSYSPKVFIPLTQLCRDYCHYCTFSRPPTRGQKAYLSADEVLAIARAGAAAGCTEALFTLGDKPELRHPIARAELNAMGYATTIDYLAAMCALVLRETSLLPHVNAGVMSRDDIAKLRTVSASQGLMLESIAERLCQRGGAHYQSPDKAPAARIETIRLAGELKVPFTSGILIGIGETRDERLDALLALRDLHAEFGHIQEVIVQNFRAKRRTPMAGAAEPDMDDLLWTIAAARLTLGPSMNIQAPPNLSSADFPRLLDAGINDWGGVSPVTPDHVNPEAPWPELETLRAGTTSRDRVLVKRLPVYPRFNDARWLEPKVAARVRQLSDADGWSRDDDWAAGGVPAPRFQRSDGAASDAVRALVDRVRDAEPVEADLIALFQARGADVDFICDTADDLRRAVAGDAVSYVVNRNINYTNICLYSCGFCAFSKGATHENLRGKPYDLDHDEISRRVREAVARGATEVCLQGGIHPSYTGETYLSLLRTVRSASADVHIHAFSPLEIMHGASTLGLPLGEYLLRLKAEGLGTLPGTAAEILDDDIRALICPDKLNTEEWLAVMEAAHGVGLRTTATIMFGHLEAPAHWTRHLLRVRALQARTGGFTEFVPLPFVHMEAPMALRGQTRNGPTFREARLMHAIARLALHPLITNIQASWTKLGPEGARICLGAGANDLGGTLMNESISRAAGASHGQEMPPEAMNALITASGRIPLQRTTLYAPVTEAQHRRGLGAAPLAPIIQTPPRKRARMESEVA